LNSLTKIASYTAVGLVLSSAPAFAAKMSGGVDVALAPLPVCAFPSDRPFTQVYPASRNRQR